MQFHIKDISKANELNDMAIVSIFKPQSRHITIY